MNKARIAAFLLGAVWLLGGVASADIAFPARLDVTEGEPGVYEVSFTLPIVEGRKLRAEPRLPPSCRPHWWVRRSWSRDCSGLRPISPSR